MSQTAIMYPVFLQVFLTFAVLILMGQARKRSMIEKKHSLNDPEIRSGTVEWSDEAHNYGRNFVNQFELPVLFYAAVAFALILKKADIFMIALAWVFALTRVAQTYQHVGANIVRYRGSFYLVGALALLGMWLILAVRMMLGL
jgi:hypothetical protein